ncbi:hypothetical protein [Anaerolinea thermophila]|uniref:hypothetical protein n=1 Tax=Anaerolinea thermophila TaxID=167964 RepID=UPI00261E1D72|nr:hypothetical protein [Anaerolinea thermophila]
MLARSGGWRVVAGSIPARLNGQPGETGKAPYQLDDMVNPPFSPPFSQPRRDGGAVPPPWWVQLPPGWSAEPVGAADPISRQVQPGAP